MTCEEYRALLPRDPSTITRAERGAFLGHHYACMACRSECLRYARQQKYAQADIDRCSRLLEDDLNDPEFIRLVRR